MPLTAFERGLRPAPSSNRPLVLAVLLAGLFAVLAWLALPQGWFEAPAPRRPVPGGAAPTVAPAPTVPAPPAASPAPWPSQRIERVTKCVDSAGAASYADGPCAPGLRGATVELRPDSNLADGMSAGAREASAQQNRDAAQARAAHERRAALQADGAVQACADIDAEIAWLDAAARQPQRAASQDRLRERRKQLRDLQFRSRCR
ncbi:hypothetical protein [Variovorax boronicumulans]|uniref:hypothetical protein n=1 Tax=Variovorax boronicumulans TaxID=436515 RepID=UPI001C590CB2